jgi:NADPH:quinone reductase-like Zn-dependent oxidoreductase
MVRKPEGLSHAEACTIPLGGRHALFFLRKAGVKGGDEILINGAGGTIGTYAIEIAKQMGGIVTAVDSTKKQEMMKSIGADFVIDYNTQDFAELDKKYDIVFDIVGSHSFNRGIKVLKDDGFYLCSNPKISHIYKGWKVKRRSNKSVFSGLLKEDVADLDHVAKEISEGRLSVVIDREITLEEIVDGHAFVETGEKLGHVVIILKE